jgi:hypothetical protein
MPDPLPKKSKTPAQEAFETLAFLWGGLAFTAFFGWQYKVPVVHPLVQQVNRALSPYTLAWLEKTFGRVNPALGLLFDFAIVTTVLFVFSMTLIAAHRLTLILTISKLLGRLRGCDPMSPRLCRTGK